MAWYEATPKPNKRHSHNFRGLFPGPQNQAQTSYQTIKMHFTETKTPNPEK